MYPFNVGEYSKHVLSQFYKNSTIIFEKENRFFSRIFTTLIKFFPVKKYSVTMFMLGYDYKLPENVTNKRQHV